MKPLFSHPLTPRPQLQQHQFNQSGLGSKFFWILLFSLMASCFSVMQAQNLMKNGSFESGNFTHWQNSGSTIVTGHNQCHSTYAAWINNNQGSSRAYAIQEIPGTSDKEYVLTFRAQRRTEGHNRVRLQAVDTDGNILSEVNVQIEKQSWETYTLTLTGTPDRTAFICVVVEGSDGGSIKVDCFELEESSSPSYSQSWYIGCDEKGTVDIYSSSVDCALSRNSEVKIPSSTSVDRVVVEVVYKSQNPGASISANVNGSNITLNKVEIGGGSSGEYVYRGEWSGMAHTVFHNSATGSCGNGKGLQSLVVYAFRNQNSAVTSVGQFTSVSGYCDLQGFTLGIPKGSGPRDLTIKLPISELTTDGRFLTINASAGNKSATKTIYGPPSGTCCVDVVEIELKDVPGNVNTVSFEVDTRRGSNPNGGGCGQSYVISGGMAVEVECPKDQCEDFYAIAESDLNLVEERIVSNIQTSCGTGNSNAFWHNCLFASGCSGSSKTWKAIGNPTFTEYTDGTAILDMTVQNLSKTDHKFQVYVLFDQRQKNPPSGSPKLDLCGITADPDWYYYQVTQGSLIGLEALEGANLSISRKSSSFQLGTGANLHEQNEFGASGWLFYNILSQPDSGPALRDDAALDINIRLSGKTYEFNSSSEKICAGEKANLEAFATGGTAPYTYKWSHGLGSGKTKMVHPSETTTYSVTITDNKGCETEDQVTVYVKECSKLGDKVWIDENGDGRQDSGEPGLDGVKVELKQNGRVIKTDHTSGGGYYLFDNLSSGSYKICFTLPNGYKFTKQNVGPDDNDSDVDPANGMTDVYVLGDNENNLTIDAGLYRPASLGDFVFLDKNKNGQQDPDEKGLKDIPVELFDAAGNSLGSQLTNGNGLYYFGDLAPGKYYVKFSALSGLMFTTPNQGSNDTRDSDVDDSNGSGTTQLYTLTSNEYDPDIDAGLKCTVSVNAGSDLNTCEGQCVDITAIAAGGSGTYTYTWDQGLGTGQNKTVCPKTTTTYTVTVTDVDGCCVVTDEVTVRVKPCIDLQLIKTVDNPTPNVGDLVTFTIQVTNDGPSQATGVDIQDVIPNGYSSISSISNGGTLSGSTINWNNQTFSNGESRNYTFKARVNAPGAGVDYDNLAEIMDADQEDTDSTPGNGADTDGDGRVGPLDPDGSQDPGDEDDGDNAEVSPEVIDLELIKSVSKSNPIAGETITFSIKVSNTGPARATGVDVVDDLPNGYDNFNASASGGTLSGNQLSWNNLTIPSGGMVTLTFTARVLAPGTGISYVNIAEVSDADQYDEDSTPGNGADTDNDGSIGPLDPDGSQDPDDEDDGDDAEVNPSCDLVADAGNNRTICEGDCSDLRASATGGSGTYYYVWDNGLGVSATHQVCPTRTTTYKVTVTDLVTGCVDIDQLTVTVSPEVNVNAGANQTKCEQECVELTATPSGGTAPYNYEWSNGDRTKSTEVCNSTNQTFRVTITDDHGCTAKDQVTVETIKCGSIGNFVFEDINGNGVQDAGEPGIPNVLVTLTDGNGNPLKSERTDADGFYLFDTLAAMSYRVEFDLPAGFDKFTASNVGLDDKDSDANPNTGITGVINLSPGEQDLTVDAGVYKYASLGDYVWEDKNGDGLQQFDEPGINGILVTLKTRGGVTLATTVTAPDGGEDGRYIFDNLEPGDYIVNFDLPDDGEFTNANVAGNDGIDSDADVQTGDSPLVSLASGETNLTIDAGIINNIDLELIKSVSDATPNVGDVITFTITVTNNGPADATGVQVQDVLPNGYTNISNISAGGNRSGNTITWNSLDIADGAAVNLTFRALVEAPGTGITYQNIAEITDADQEDSDSTPNNGADTDGDGSVGPLDPDGSQDPDDEDDGDDATVTPQTIDLELIKRVSDATPNVGDIVTFTIELVNQGPANATGVAVEDAVPNGYSSISNISSGGSLSGNNISWDNLFIGAGNVINLTFRARVEAPTAGIDYQNIAEVTDADQYDEDSTPNNGADTDNDGKVGPLDTDGSQDPDDEDDGDDAVVIPACDLTADAGPDRSICEGDCTSLIASATGGSGTYYYVWDNGLGVSATHQVCPTATTTYSVTVTDLVTGCEDTDEITVTVYSAVSVNAGANVTTCAGSCVNLEATPSGGKAPYTYAWSNGDNGKIIEVCPTSNTSYTVTVTDANGCKNSDIVTVETQECGSIGNYVFEDSNGNGQQDAGEPGIDGVLVTLTDGFGNPLQTRTTTGNGFYLFDTLEAGSYMVLFTLPQDYDAFTPSNVGPDATDSDANPQTGMSGIINLSAGENNLTVDAGLYQFASLGDFVWEDLNGNGSQDAGEPGANGLLVRLLNASGALEATTVTSTNAGQDGFYEFTDLAPGTYTVQFSKPFDFEFTTSNSPLTVDDVDSDANTTTGESPSVVLASGENNPTIDAGIIKLGTIGDFVWNDLNGNGEQDTGEPGKNGVIVYLWEDTNADGNPDGLVSTQITRTVGGQSGFYQFTDVRPGTYIVQFDSPLDCIPSPKNEVGVSDVNDSDADPTTGNTDVIAIESGTDNQTIDAGFFSPICVGDYVFEDVDNNGRQDVQDIGINGVTVNLFASDGTLIESQVTRPNPQTGQDGYYKFNVALPGDYYLEFDASGVNGDYVPTFENIGNDDLDSDVDGSNGPNTTTTFTLQGGDDNRTVDAGFWTPSSLGNYVWEDLNIDGIQNDGRTSGLNGIIVELVEAGTNFVIETRLTSNNPDNGNPGFYLFENLIPGDYYVRFITPTGSSLIPTDADQTGETLDSDLSTFNGPNTSSTVTLGRNEDRRDVDAGFFQPSKIGDYVFEDIGEGNALNGVQDVNEGGLAGTTVTLIDALTMAPVPGVAPIVTAANGFYQFCVRPGTYFVQFDPPSGYITSPMDATSDDLDSDVSHTFGPNTTRAVTIGYGETNSDVDAGYFDQALPVQLMTFDAERNGEEVWVNWSTLSETNADFYIVERRFENEAEWSSIGNQDAKGASNSMNYYSLVDDGIDNEGIYFYRLKQMDQDGGYTYSQIESVFIDWDDSEAFDINVYPNPASHHLIIDYVGNIPSVDLKISIVSVDGKMSRQLLGTTHAQRVKVDLSNIPEGVYQIQLQDYDQIIQKTIVIVK